MHRSLSKHIGNALKSAAIITSFGVAAGCGAGGDEPCDGYGCQSNGPSVISPTACDSSKMTCPCGPDATCSAGMECLDGLCLRPCMFTSECGASSACVNGKCIPSCGTQNPCETGYVCNKNGVCEADTANPQCKDDAGCTGGLACVAGMCRDRCASNTCPAGQLCNPSTGACMPDPQPVALCAKDPSACRDGSSCINGFCRYPCADTAACKLRDGRFLCAEKLCMLESEANPQCTKKDDCPVGQDCISNACR